MPKNNGTKKKVFKVVIMLSVILAMLSGVFVWWAGNTYKPSPIALNALKDDKNIDVTDNDYIAFMPKNEKPTKGFIFYPGGKVEPESYATLCRKIAEEGYLVVIAPMTMDLAILSPNKAEQIINDFNDIDEWAIGGHSLGGVMAAKYASENSNIKGLALYAAYPQGEELKDLDLKVVSIYGSEDGVADVDKIKNALLTKNSKLIEIEGGNHGNFGSYGKQAGDNEGKISEEEQINQAVKYTVELMREI